MDDTEYKAVLSLTSTGIPGESVKFELKFSHDRDELGDNQPVSFQTMDFIYETALAPFLAAVAEFTGMEVEGTEAVN